MTKMEKFVSQCKECMSELDGVIREVVKRAHHIHLETQGEISR
jgi:hypothetical protein